MAEKSNIDKWANFLFNEKLDPKDLQYEEDVIILIDLYVELAKTRGPKIKMHKLKLESRAFVCNTAMDLGIDLPAIKNMNGKMAMGRGLLDAWNLAYTKRHGSIIGTASWMEAKRRDVKTRLCNEGIKGVSRFQHKPTVEEQRQLDDSAKTFVDLYEKKLKDS